LSSDELLITYLKEYFILFKPKDVVSGDFYWASELNNKQFAIVTADSTGHGVPGAIMSLLNITSLEKAIEQHTSPSEILNSTRKTIIERLKRDGSAEGGKDGMDCTLISLDLKNAKLTYAAANNPIWIIRERAIIELAPDKMPGGKHDRDTVSFLQHEVDLQVGDMIYTITDGLPDQFGGPKGKKFMYKQLKEILIHISHLPAAEQKHKLSQSLAEWMSWTEFQGNAKEMEQVDDITVIGIRI